jgi:hypothetical protein
MYRLSPGGGQVLRSPLFSVILALALSSAGFHPGASAQTAAADRRTHGTASCRVETPVQWNVGHVTWIGGCKDGYAEGLGVLRNTVEGTSAELFLGRVDRGNLRSGVLVTAQGYTAGRWEAGSVAESGTDDQANRNAILAGFEDGAKAADTISRSMARHSNPKTSRFYTRLAKRLRSQMD